MQLNAFSLHIFVCAKKCEARQEQQIYSKNDRVFLCWVNRKKTIKKGIFETIYALLRCNVCLA